MISIFLDQKRLAFIIADVSGKGIPAAMFMMTAKTLIKSLAESGISLSDVFNEANARLCENNDAAMFVTAWMGILHTDTGLVEFVNASHNPPLLQQQGSFTYLRTRPGFVLGGMQGIKYVTHEIQLSPADMLLLYTDGLTEAMNQENQLFGNDQVLTVLADQPPETAEQAIQVLMASVAAFADGAEQSDDITLLSLKYMGHDKL